MDQWHGSAATLGKALVATYLGNGPVVTFGDGSVVTLWKYISDSTLGMDQRRQHLKNPSVKIFGEWTTDNT